MAHFLSNQGSARAAQYGCSLLMDYSRAANVLVSFTPGSQPESWRTRGYSYFRPPA